MLKESSKIFSAMYKCSKPASRPQVKNMRNFSVYTRKQTNIRRANKRREIVLEAHLCDGMGVRDTIFP